MKSLNEVKIIGHLGSDPEKRTMSNGKMVVSFRVATTESWKDKATGEKKEQTEWHSVVIFNEGLGGVAADYLRKGAPVFIEGKLQTRKWSDKEGVERYSTEIVLSAMNGNLILLGGNQKGGKSQAAKPTQGRREHQPLDDDNDEIPF